MQNTFLRLSEGGGSPNPTEQGNELEVINNGIEDEDMWAENEDEQFPDGDIYLADDEDSDYDFPSTQPVSTLICCFIHFFIWSIDTQWTDREDAVAN